MSSSGKAFGDGVTGWPNVPVGSAGAAFAPANDAIAAEEGPIGELLAAFRAGKPLVTLRARAEYADAEGAKASEAYTTRLALGYETGNYYGFKVLAELEDVRSLDDSLYNAAGLNGEGAHTVIADPEGTALNRLHVTYNKEEWGTQVKIGRQRILIADQRFVGNVGWRQNEQTFDAAGIQVSAADGVTIAYHYLWHINRIFGDDASAAFPDMRRDFDSDSHLLHLTYDATPELNVEVFSYFLDFSGPNTTARANSSTTYGVRASGAVDYDGEFALGYEGSYAHQVDGEDNPTHYRADYFRGAGWAQTDALGRITVGYEYLGTYNGRAQFRTPLATGHKFNGWADSFLDNGGAKGLTDVFVGVSPTLPWELNGGVFYHKFNNADGGSSLGWEVDAFVKRKLHKNLSALLKAAYFEGPSDPDIHRVWFQLTYQL